MTRQLKVVIDGRTLQQAPLGGVGRALALVLPRLAALVEIEVLVDARLDRVALDVPSRSLRAPLPGYSAWLQMAVPGALRAADVFHCPFYGLPMRQPVPMVVTLHDLTYEHFPGWMPTAKRLVFRAQARHAARTARRIVAVSAHVRMDCVRTYGLAEERVVVAPNPIDPRFRPRQDHEQLARLRQRLGVDGSYIVAVGGAPRRNVGTAVDAWRLLRGRGSPIDLVVVGAETPEASGLQPRYAGALSDADWSSLLAGASALCYPTLYEGFGMPAMEAVASGVPVVCARVGALPEVLGDAAEWADSPTTEGIAEALGRVLSGPARRQELVELGLARAAANAGPVDVAAILARAYIEAAGWG